MVVGTWGEGKKEEIEGREGGREGGGERRKGGREACTDIHRKLTSTLYHTTISTKKRGGYRGGRERQEK